VSEPATSRGRGKSRQAASAARSLSERLDDPDEPLYTMAVAAELIGTDNQTLRRLGEAIAHEGARPSGNQRRYSRRDLEALDNALRLVREGHPPQSVARIVQLEHRINDLTAGTKER
jgi:MerR family transcriptional regulator, heat shock protein HspR